VTLTIQRRVGPGEGFHAHPGAIIKMDMVKDINAKGVSRRRRPNRLRSAYGFGDRAGEELEARPGQAESEGHEGVDH